jgi:hypothetical protein
MRAQGNAVGLALGRRSFPAHDLHGRPAVRFQRYSRLIESANDGRGDKSPPGRTTRGDRPVEVVKVIGHAQDPTLPARLSGAATRPYWVGVAGLMPSPT